MQKEIKEALLTGWPFGQVKMEIFFFGKQIYLLRGALVQGRPQMALYELR